MAASKDRERRRAVRADLATFSMATFAYQGQTHEVMMMNVSELGARFRTPEYHDRFKLRMDDELTMTIKTAYGMTTIKGVVKWIQDLNDMYSWGIEFNEPITEPLKNLLDSSF